MLLKFNNSMSSRFSSGKTLLRSGALIAILFLSGCGGDGLQDLREFVDTAYQDRRPEIEPLPEMQPFEKYEYAAFDLPDPFSLGNVVTQEAAGGDDAGLRPDPDRPREPLESYPLDALTMSGTLVRNEQAWAVIQTTQGIAHFLTVGNYMGQNDGQIKEINTEQQKVILTETVRNASGRWEARDVELTIDEQ